MDNSMITFMPRNFDEFLTGRGIFWFCDDSYKVTPKDMEIYLRETRRPMQEKLVPAPQANYMSQNIENSYLPKPVYFSYANNVQPAPSPASCQTPNSGSTSSLSSLNGERHPSTCAICRMPLCGEIVMCKEREKADGSKLGLSLMNN